MRALSLALVAVLVLGTPAQAQPLAWYLSESDGFVTAQNVGFMKGLTVACGGGLKVSYYVPDLPANFAGIDSGTLVIRTDAGAEIERDVTRRDAWSFDETGAEAVDVATALYAANTAIVSLGSQQVDEIDIEAGRAELFAALDACRVNVSPPSEDDEGVEIPADRWIFAERPDDGPFAATRAGEALVLITCSYGRYQLDYSFPEADIDRELARGDRADLVLGIDGSPSSFFDAVQGMRGSGRMTFTVPADQWLDLLSGAGETIYLSLEETGSNRSGNIADFTARGSTAAIANLRKARQPA